MYPILATLLLTNIVTTKKNRNWINAGVWWQIELSPKDIGVPEAGVVLQCVVMGFVLHNRISRQIQDSFHCIPIGMTFTKNPNTD